MNRLEAKAIYKLLAGGLYTDDNSEGLGLQDAALKIAAAQLRAIRFALTVNNDTDPPSHEHEHDDRQSWCAGDDRFDRADAFLALGGVMAMLDNIHHVSRDVVRALEPEEAVHQ